MVRHQCDIDAAFLHSHLDLRFAQFRDAEGDVRVAHPPAAKELTKRRADRRHAHRKANFTNHAVTVPVARELGSIEFRQRPADMRQNRLAAAGQPNACMRAFEQRQTKLVLQSPDPAADCGRVDPERFGSAGEV